MIDDTTIRAIDTIGLQAVEAIFDALGDVAFFVKDRDGRYLSINRTMVRRCGVRHKEDVIGKTALDLFPRALAITPGRTIARSHRRSSTWGWQVSPGVRYR